LHGFLLSSSAMKSEPGQLLRMTSICVVEQLSTSAGIRPRVICGQAPRRACSMGGHMCSSIAALQAGMAVSWS
nr:hypothetical protein [Tanacetum cinerariifolium]